MSVEKKSITTTKNYRLFARSDDNRALCMKKHKKLFDSMKVYGFLEAYPIVCQRNGDKHLIVKDGQHRLAVAEELGLAVAYVVDKTDFDVAIVNSTAKVWTLVDYAQKHAANGKQVYKDGIDFAEQHALPIGIAFALLAGTTSFGNIAPAFIDGTFKSKDRTWADAVASLYSAMVHLSGNLRSARFLEACMAVCRVPEFSQERMLRCANMCREKLVAYGTKDGYLDMLQDVYNHFQKKLVPLKIAAIQAMRDRSAIKSNGAKDSK